MKDTEFSKDIFMAFLSNLFDQRKLLISGLLNIPKADMTDNNPRIKQIEAELKKIDEFLTLIMSKI